MENKYDKYKDSGIEWIGEIPEHWELRKGKNLFKLRNSKGNINAILLAASQKFGMIPQTQVEGVVQVKQNTDLNTFRTVHKNDYVISLRSFQGGFEMSEYEGVCSPAYQVFYSKTPCCNYFFKYMFKSYGFISQINAFTLGIREGKNIQYEDFSLMKLPLPTLQEQQSIATYLDQKCGEIDELITLQEEMITKLQSYKQSVITETVTKGLDKNAPLKDSGIEWIGEIPEHWDICQLKRCSRFINGYAFNSNNFNKDYGVPVIRIGDIVDEQVSFENIVYVQENNELERFIVHKNDILIAMSGATVGKIGIYYAENKAYINQRVGIIRTAQYNFIKRMFATHGFIDYVILSSAGSAQPNISSDGILNFYIPMPLISEQQSIADYLDQKCGEIDELISIKQQKIEKLKDYKKSLIFECVTGKRKVC